MKKNFFWQNSKSWFVYFTETEKAHSGNGLKIIHYIQTWPPLKGHVRFQGHYIFIQVYPRGNIRAQPRSKKWMQHHFWRGFTVWFQCWRRQNQMHRITKWHNNWGQYSCQTLYCQFLWNNAYGRYEFELTYLCFWFLFLRMPYIFKILVKWSRIQCIIFCHLKVQLNFDLDQNILAMLKCVNLLCEISLFPMFKNIWLHS